MQVVKETTLSAEVDDTMILTHETFMKPYLKYYGLEPIIKDKEWLEEEELLNPKNRVRATVSAASAGLPLLD